MISDVIYEFVEVELELCVESFLYSCFLVGTGTCDQC